MFEQFLCHFAANVNVPSGFFNAKMPRACPVESHARYYASGLTATAKTPRGEPVASSLWRLSFLSR